MTHFTMTAEDCMVMVSICIAVANTAVLSLVYDVVRPKQQSPPSPPSLSAATARTRDQQSPEVHLKSIELAGIGALVIAGSAFAGRYGMCVRTVNAGLHMSGMFLMMVGAVVHWDKSPALRFAVWASSLALLVYTGVRLHSTD